MKAIKLPNRRMRWFVLGIMCYLFAAFAWWAVLLFRQNDQILESKAQKHELAKKTNTPSDDAVWLDDVAKHSRQRKMIYGEGLFFTISLALGIWYINRAHLKEMQLAHQQKGFMLSITHELKTPLAGIQMGLDTIKSNIKNQDALVKIADVALNESGRLKRLVDNLLLSTRMEVAGYTPMFEPVQLNDVCKNVIHALQLQYKNKVINFEASNSNIVLQADLAGLTSIIYNLLENAIKYSPSIDPIQLECISDKHQVAIKVKDQGIGISPKLRQTIFQKFYRIDDENTRKTQGTGLGLYIVAGLVSAHNGSITLTHNQPKGSVFTVSLPLQLA